jgi:hypothetical protein
MHIPALVTQAPRGVLGTLSDDGTEVIYGDEKILTDFRNGGRIRFGAWLEPCHRLGVEGEYILLHDLHETFSAYSSGIPTIARPFYNSETNEQDSELVGYLPAVGTVLDNSGAIVGTVTVKSNSSFQSAGGHLRINLLCCPSAGCGPSRRVDILSGYRFLNLREGVGIHEDLYSLDPTEASDSTRGNVAFKVHDLFDAETTFHGGELGLLWLCERARWSLEILARLGIGSNRQRVRINGYTTQIDTATGTSTTSRVDVGPEVAGVFTGGGLLAQRSNIGTYTRDRFALVPEVGVTLGYQVNRHWRATAGYSLIFWTHVVRPGEQIDTTVNPNFLPDEASPITGAQRPAFAFHETSLWAQGFNLGFECTW